ncbi:hypothetical protein GGR52DRAFT_184191 [Hypoxylon sp. FL1284]|nr:hypothetical protein GGR52DRAFT_184191 [Hypoxylon sp. FL1284]
MCSATQMPPLAIPPPVSVPAPGPAPGPAPSTTSSCASCRRRKIRCNRAVPCSNCVKANYHCDYPRVGRKGRPKADGNGPRYDRTAQARLLDKVQRLEKLVEDLNGQVDAATQEPGTPTPNVGRRRLADINRPGSRPRDPGSVGSISDQDLPEKEVKREEPGLLVSHNRGKLYVSGDFWATLRKEVRQVRESFELEGEGNAAEDCDDEDDALSPSTSTPSNIGTSAFIFPEANSFDRGLTDAMFPMPSQMLFIWRTYIENIDPLVKVLHIPTMTAVLERCRGQIRTLDADMLSLFACISFAAIQSMPPEDVLLNFGMDKKTLLSSYRRGAEQTLSNADVINTTSLAPVQALAIYLSVLQGIETFRHIWTLIGILVRVALSLGLHRDGKSFQDISPFDIEMRRRLWWNVYILDARSGESQMAVVLVHQDMFTTEVPTSVNDTDIWPDMTEPAVERSGSTDLTVLLARCKLWHFGRVIQDLSLDRATTTDGNDHRAIYDRKLEAIQKLKTDIAEYGSLLKGCPGPAPFVSEVAHILADRVELMAHYQYTAGERQEESSFTRGTYQIALDIVERSHFVEFSPEMSRWAWALRGTVQWQAMGIILSHLCDVPWDEESEKAWLLIELSFSNMVKSSTREPLWKPFQRLFARAQQCRSRFLETRRMGAQASKAASDSIRQSVTAARSAHRTTPSNSVEIRRAAPGDESTAMCASEQVTDTTPIFTTNFTPAPQPLQFTNGDMGVGIASQPARDVNFDARIGAGDGAPMDLNDWQQWNDWQQGFWGFSL